MHSGVLKYDGNLKRGRGRPKLTWEETVRKNLKEWNIFGDLALNRSVWKAAIHVPEP